LENRALYGPAIFMFSLATTFANSNWPTNYLANLPDIGHGMRYGLALITDI
jgi:hypothetical protein